MLKVIKLSKKFDAKLALDGVSFKIDKGQVVGLLGPNGAGKTTLMRLLVGYLNLKSGRILWEGKLVDTRCKRHKRRLGYLPENNPLYNNMYVGEYLEYMAQLKDVEDVDRELDRVGSECGLVEVMGQKIETFAKGYRQRVGIAGAILGNPKLLILDEPTTGLDPNQIIEIRNLIKKLSVGRIVLLSTHILPEAKQICDQIILISGGKIVLDAKTNKIKNLEKKFVELTN